MILKEEITRKDLIFIDYPLYSSLANILESIEFSKIKNIHFNEKECIKSLC